jgi:hypothetical protein
MKSMKAKHREIYDQRVYLCGTSATPRCAGVTSASETVWTSSANAAKWASQYGVKPSCFGTRVR